jgi:hypothetical protein
MPMCHFAPAYKHWQRKRPLEEVRFQSPEALEQSANTPMHHVMGSALHRTAPLCVQRNFARITTCIICGHGAVHVQVTMLN